MRIVCAILSGLLVASAGCLGATNDPGQPQNEERTTEPARIHPDGTPEFCESEAVCDFWDQDFHEYVVYDLDTYVFDVVVLPPAGNAVDAVAAARLAVQAWEDGIREFAATWLNKSFEINVYAVGIDVPSVAAVEDPEIVVLSTSARQVIGIGLEPVQLGCRIIDALTKESFDVHQHGGMFVKAENCVGTGFTCFAINVGEWEPMDLYDLVAHEVGHCLGAGHVGDAGDFRARYAPVEDIMSYQSNSTQVHCVSNLNMRVLEGVYAHLLDQPEEIRLPYGSFYNMSAKDYRQATCRNP